MKATATALEASRTEHPRTPPPAPEVSNLDALNLALEGLAPEAILAWATRTFPNQLCLQSSMQRRSSVLAHMLWRGGHTDVPVLFVDTGYHFKETLELRDELVTAYGLEVITVHPELTPIEQEDQYGAELWRYPETYELCCHLRKERPFVRAASRFAAVISGLQRSEGGTRSEVPFVGWDPRVEAFTISPLAAWPRRALDDYVEHHEVPLHPLYEQGYPSIGCSTCTTPCAEGESPRAGRWRHIREALEAEGSGQDPIYCKINWIDQTPPSPDR